MGTNNVYLTTSSAGNNIMSLNYIDMVNYRETLSLQAMNAAQTLNTEKTEEKTIEDLFNVDYSVYWADR